MIRSSSKILSILCIALLSIAHAQPLDLTYFKALSPRSIGPAGMSGRVTAIDVIRERPEYIFIGTASGGVWQSKDGGTTWKPIFDDGPIQAIGALAINQKNPSEIWVGTGEGNPRNSQNSGIGIFKSIDGGRTWKNMGLNATKTIHRILINPFNTEEVYVAAHGSAWGPNEERGVYKTIDGGTTWKKILYVNDLTGCAELIADPNNPNKLFAAMYEYERKPYFFTSGGKGSGLYLTYDGGETWKKLSDKDGLPKGDLGRIGLAMSKSNSDVVYALIESKKLALYKSIDGGHNWKEVNDKKVGNRPFYYAEIHADPQNANLLYSLFSFVNRSDDGGRSMQTMMPYSGYHPDHHAWYIHPDNPKFMIDGNDGGLNITYDGGENWRFVENLPLGQFYHIHYDMELPYNVYGGLQDNGSWRGPSSVWRSGGIRNSYWEELLFGDGFDVLPHRENSSMGYAMYQGGNLYRYQIGSGFNQSIKPVHPEGENLRFNWNAAIAEDPFDVNALYFGSQFLHYSTDMGNSWEIISPDLTTNNSEKQKQTESGGLTIDATQAENYTTITAISASTLNKNVIWVGTDDGRIQATNDKGKTWKSFENQIKGMPKNAWVHQIIASTYNENEAFVVCNNYRQNDWKPYLFYTNDFGKTWKSIITGSDIPKYTLSFAQDFKEKNLLFLGTEEGLFISVDFGKNWVRWDKGFPAVPIMDLKIHPRENDLIIGTFGRAIYILDDIQALREIAKTQGKILDNDLELFSANDAFLVEYKAAMGVRFAADATFFGKNKPNGAQLTFWLHPKHFEVKKDSTTEKETKKEDAKNKDFLVTVFNNIGDTIRHYSIKPDTGMNRITWNLRADADGLTKKYIEKNKYPHAGMYVSPGEYKVKIDYRGFSDSTLVMVKFPEAEKPSFKNENAENRLAAAYLLINQTKDQISEARQKIKTVSSTLTFKDDSLKKQITVKGKDLEKQLKATLELFELPEDFVGYDHVSVRIGGLYYKASSYYNSGMNAAPKQFDFIMNHLEKDLHAAVEKLNVILGEEWETYVNLVNENQEPILETLPAIELKR